MLASICTLVCLHWRISLVAYMSECMNSYVYISTYFCNAHVRLSVSSYACMRVVVCMHLYIISACMCPYVYLRVYIRAHKCMETYVLCIYIHIRVRRLETACCFINFTLWESRNFFTWGIATGQQCPRLAMALGREAEGTHQYCTCTVPEVQLWYFIRLRWYAVKYIRWWLGGDDNIHI